MYVCICVFMRLFIEGKYPRLLVCPHKLPPDSTQCTDRPSLSSLVPACQCVRAKRSCEWWGGGGLEAGAVCHGVGVCGRTAANPAAHALLFIPKRPSQCCMFHRSPLDSALLQFAKTKTHRRQNSLLICRQSYTAIIKASFLGVLPKAVLRILCTFEQMERSR